jgi:N6-adenosine-specific RNA methylase IME4
MVPNQTDEEFQSLVESIKLDGQYYPIIVNEQGFVLDGHHRYKACRHLKIEPKFQVKHDIKDKWHELLFVIDTNLKRRHMNAFQRIELALKAKPALEHIADQNRLSNLKQNVTSSVKSFTVGRVDQEIGDRAKASHVTIKKAETIIKKSSENVKQSLRSGKVSIEYAYKSVKRSEDSKEIKPLPHGQFSVIVADPPWPYDINTRGSPDDHYAVMTQQDIELLQIPSADNAMLFLWATNPKLKQALDVMAAWGFKYKTNMVWVKDKIGTGYYCRGKHELLLIGEKGDMPVPEEKNRPASVIEAPRGKHSEKPDQVYQIIEQMYPNRQPYLELFARNQHSENWTVWGNEMADA